ncbi:hypothetical protein ACFLX2_01420 [Candidatus Dependentiae bacterium]
MKNQKLFAIFTAVLFLFLVAVAVFRLFYQVRTSADQIIAREVKQLSRTIMQIHERCKIIGFKHKKTPINFLNVQEFAGSRVGSMILAHPERWDGPYMKDNPTIQEKEYQIVRTKKGYFITPGDGVRLANGKIVGKDIVLDENANIPAMAVDQNALMFETKPLAAVLPLGAKGVQELSFIHPEIQYLVKIFKRIDKKCRIIDFDSQKSPINFLNVKKFVGSEVGAMNLKYPGQWDGPYLKENPTIQKKEYQVVQAKKGYFITPGSGVKLPNGKIIGKDILLDEDADIAAMMFDKDALMIEGKAWAAPLPVGATAAEEVLRENIMRAEDGLVMNDIPVDLLFAFDW